MGMSAEWMIAIVGIVCTAFGFLIAKMLNNTDDRLNELEKEIKEMRKEFSDYRVHVVEKILSLIKDETK